MVLTHTNLTWATDEASKYFHFNKGADSCPVHQQEEMLHKEGARTDLAGACPPALLLTPSLSRPSSLTEE